MLENHKVFTTTIGGKEVSVDVGKYAQQANGSCMVRCGETVVMVNVTMAPVPREGMDFFPLSVDYEEKCTPSVKFPAVSKRERAGQAIRRFSYPDLSTDLSDLCSPKGFSTT